MRITANVAMDTLRRRRRLPQTTLSEAVTETRPDPRRAASPEALLLLEEERYAVHVALSRLAPTQRAARQF